MATTKWVLDPAHSELHFKVRHMMIANVSGSFNKFDATVESEDDQFNASKIHFQADVDSITTNNEQRDGHLKSPDFFDAVAYPHITFTASGMEPKGDEHYTLHGELTLHGTTLPVTLQVEHGGVTKDGWGNTRTGFSIEGKINRKDFGLMWDTATETGGVVLGNEVKISANVQFIKA